MSLARRYKGIDLTHDATTEGQPQGEVLKVAAPSGGAQLELARLDGWSVDDVANQNAIGAIMVEHRIDVPDTQATDINTTLQHKERVIDVHVVKTGGAGGVGDTITVKNGAAAITGALDLNVADQTTVRASTIDDAFHEIAAGGTLRVTPAGQPGVASTVYVKCVRVP